jgi:hypothetical protein
MTGNAQPANPSLLRAAYRERLRAALRIPTVEAYFPAPWTAAARRIMPSPSPQLTATAMWGPVLGWCALELLAESIDAENPEGMALELFDRLRLREPFAQSFAALGFEGEEAWRVAARIKVLLLSGTAFGKTENVAAIAPALWSDPDVRWLCGVHEAEGHEYLVRERYEEMLWWLLMPAFLRLAGVAAPSRAAVKAMSESIEKALAAAESVGYQVDKLISQAVDAGDDAGVEAEVAPTAFVLPLPTEEPRIEANTEVEAEARPLTTEEPEIEPLSESAANSGDPT